MGDSITESWPEFMPNLFSSRGWLVRGRAGDTTNRMLQRFAVDVLQSSPTGVHILAGINDLAENDGPITVEAIQSNIEAMIELSLSCGILVVIGTILPCERIPWRPELIVKTKIEELNGWIRNLPFRNQNVVCVDYYSLLVTSGCEKLSGLSDDGLHLNRSGYSMISHFLLNFVDKKQIEC